MEQKNTKGNNVDKEKLKEFEKLQKEYKKKKAEKRKRIFRNIMSHILFFFFPGTFVKNNFESKIVRNLITYGLQVLGIAMQIFSIVFLIQGFKILATDFSQFTHEFISAIFVFLGGLYMRIIGVKNETENNIGKPAICACVCSVLMFLVFYF